MKLLKFKADWCAPCRTLTTMLDGFETYPIETVNVGLEPDRAVEYGVKSIPTLILLDDQDKEVWRHSGLIDKIKLEFELNKIKKELNEDRIS